MTTTTRTDAEIARIAQALRDPRNGGFRLDGISRREAQAVGNLLRDDHAVRVRVTRQASGWLLSLR